MPTLSTINIGAAANDGTGDSIRNAFSKARDNFNTIETTLVPTLISTAVANINSTFSGGTITNDVSITAVTNAINSTSGALTVTGGIGISGDAYFANSLTASTITATNLTAGTATATTQFIGPHNGTVGATTPNTGQFTTLDSSGGITGNLTGNLTGAVTGDVTGNVTGNVTGDVTGNVTGDTTGAHNGTVGATTPASGAFTTVSTSGDATVATGATITTGNLRVQKGNIYCLVNAAVGGRIEATSTVFGFSSIRRGQIGTDGGSGDPSNPNNFSIFTQDGDLIIKTNAIPSSATDTGTVGEVKIGTDSGTTYIYYCTATNTWVRSAFATW